MTKHLIDHRNAPETARKRNFWAIERRGTTDTAHPAIRALMQRPQTGQDGPRVQHYLRIDRGITA